ncbi:MAG: hypothetical protein OXE40_04280 [Gammaproteobacteria bacterium]|nr:hypothetical protein [Gammaproteobacteria bacterium]
MIIVSATLELATRKGRGRAAAESAHEPVCSPEGLLRETFFKGRA